MGKRAIADIDRHIAQRIAKRRVEIGMSQARLGDLVGVQLRAISRMERGGSRITAARLVLVAQALGTPVSFFFEGFGNTQAQETT